VANKEGKPRGQIQRMTEAEQEQIIQKKMAKASLQLLEDKYGNEQVSNKHLDNFMSKLRMDVEVLEPNNDVIKNTAGNTLKDFHKIYVEVLDQQKQLLKDLNRKSEFDEDLIRKYLSLVDIEEFKLREKRTWTNKHIYKKYLLPSLNRLQYTNTIDGPYKI